MHPHTDPLTVICYGSSEFADDSGRGTYWMDTRLTLGNSVGLTNALAFCEEYVRQLGRDPREALQPFCPRRVTIHDVSNRHVLSGRVAGTVVEWAEPVTSDKDAERVQIIADQLNGKGAFESSWDNYSTARGLWRQAELVEGHLVDPLWRVAALEAVQTRASISIP